MGVGGMTWSRDLMGWSGHIMGLVGWAGHMTWWGCWDELVTFPDGLVGFENQKETMVSYKFEPRGSRYKLTIRVGVQQRSVSWNSCRRLYLFTLPSNSSMYYSFVWFLQLWHQALFWFDSGTTFDPSCWNIESHDAHGKSLVQYEWLSISSLCCTKVCLLHTLSWSLGKVSVSGFCALLSQAFVAAAFFFLLFFSFFFWSLIVLVS